MCLKNLFHLSYIFCHKITYYIFRDFSNFFREFFWDYFVSGNTNNQSQIYFSQCKQIRGLGVSHVASQQKKGQHGFQVGCVRSRVEARIHAQILYCKTASSCFPINGPFKIFSDFFLLFSPIFSSFSL